MKFSLIGLSFVFIFFSVSVDAQKVRKGREVLKADVNLAELAAYYQAYPLPLVRKKVFEEDDEERPLRKAPDPSLIFNYKPKSATERTQRTFAPELPVYGATYDSIFSVRSNGTSIPPDTHGAVDSSYIVTATNQDIYVQSRTGTRLYLVSLDGFFTRVLPNGPGAFDPRIHFDPYSNRWVIAALGYGQTANSQIMIGVSATANPSGIWHLFSFPVDPTGNNWLDFDNIGFNKQWIALCGNWFANSGGGGLNGAEVYVFNKDSMLVGRSAPYTAFNETNSFSLAPAITYDTDENSLMIMEAADGSVGQLHLIEVTGTPSTPNISEIGFPACPTHWQGSAPFEADFAPQAGTTNKLQTGDDRIYSISERNGKIWCAHTVFFPAVGPPNRSSVMWWEIDTNGTVNQNGVQDDPTGQNFYAYPSLAVNQYNDVMIGYSWMSRTIFPSCAFSLHMHTQPDDSLMPKKVFKHGLANYYQTFGGGQNRWGDYSGTCIDPKNNTDFWTLQETVPGAPYTNLWEVWWSHVSTCFVIDTFTITAHSLNTTVPDTISFIGNSSAGATYTWNFSGGIATGTGSQQIVTWDSAGSKVVSLTITAPGGCTATYTDTVQLTNVGVPLVSIQNFNFDVVPNPNNGDFDVIFNKSLNKQFEIRMTDNAGRVVYYKKFIVLNNLNVPIHTSDLAAGNYVIDVIIDNVVTHKIMSIIK